MKPMYGLTRYVFPPLFFFFLLHACYTNGMGQPRGGKMRVAIDLVILLLFMFLFLFLLFFLAVVSLDKYNKM